MFIPGHKKITRILLLSSEEKERKKLERGLCEHGYDVATANNCSQAVVEFPRFLPHAILMDLDDNQYSSLNLRSALKSLPEGREVPVIGLSEFHDKHVLNGALEEGISDVLPKPIHWASLSFRLEQIHSLIKTRQKLKLSEARLATAQRLAHLGNWEQHFNTDTFICSHEAERILDLNPSDAPYNSQDIKARIHPDDLERVQYAYETALKGHGNYRAEYRVVQGNQTIRQVCVKGELRFDPETYSGFMSGTIQDITARLENENKIRHLAYYDGLTNLPNKQLFKEQFEQNILLSERYGLQCALLFVDLDEFKRINDSLGHEIGDELLKLAAGRLKDCIRQSDSVSRNINHRWMELARIGGDEFMIMLPNIDDTSDAEAVAARLLEELSTPYEIENRDFVVTASIGLACYPGDGRDFASLMKNADTAVHAAKKDGRNSYKAYKPEMSRRTEHRLHLENELRKAITGEQLMLMYQPQVDAITHEMVGVEALVRWVHPQDGIISPADFIPLAEETGLVTLLGRWVLNEACRQMTEWKANGLDHIKMSVNVSPKQLYCDSFVAHVAGVLETYKLSPSGLQLEMTESTLMGDVEDIVRRLTNIKKTGVCISIDDFGTGYSSLSHLKRYPIDVLKIDRSFVQDIGKEEDEAIIKTIIGMARTLKLGVVSEGVETKEQLEFLKKQGTRLIQGFYFSPPLTAKDIPGFESHLSKGGGIAAKISKTPTHA